MNSESSSLRPDYLNLQALQHHHTEKHPSKTPLSSKPTQTTTLPLLLLLRTYEIYTFSDFQEPDISLTTVMHYSSVSLEDFYGRHLESLQNYDVPDSSLLLFFVFYVTLNTFFVTICRKLTAFTTEITYFCLKNNID